MLRSAGASTRRGPAPRGAGGPRRGARRPARGGALARALAACGMVQGPASSVGKSVLATALVRGPPAGRTATRRCCGLPEHLRVAVRPPGEQEVLVAALAGLRAEARS